GGRRRGGIAAEPVRSVVVARRLGVVPVAGALQLGGGAGTGVEACGLDRHGAGLAVDTVAYCLSPRACATKLGPTPPRVRPWPFTSRPRALVRRSSGA